MKKLLTGIVAIVTIVSGIKAQDSTKNGRCFPFGTSLYGARVNSDGSKLSLQNVYFYHKVFDLPTGKMIAFSSDKDRAKAIDPVMEPMGYGTKEPYTVHSKEKREGKRQDYLITVKDSLGNVVTDIMEEDVIRYSFHPTSGNLVVGVGKTVSLYAPGKKKRKVGKSQTKDGYYDTWSFVEQARFSPNGRFLVSKDGYITDLQEATTLRKVFVIDDSKDIKLVGSRPFDISFDPASTTCTVSIHEKGLCTYNLATGALVDSVPIPKPVFYPALHDIFQVLQVPNSKDYIYWLRFLNKAAPGGIAYYIKDGTPLPICDPGWEVESVANFATLTKKYNEQEAREKAAAEKLRKEQEAYRLAHPNEQTTVSAKNTQRRLVQKICGYCKGTGKISFEKLIIGDNAKTSYTIDQFGNKTYKTTGGIGTAVCSGCRGKKYVEVWEN